MGSATYPDICAASQRRSHLLFSVLQVRVWRLFGRRSTAAHLLTA